MYERRRFRRPDLMAVVTTVVLLGFAVSLILPYL